MSEGLRSVENGNPTANDEITKVYARVLAEHGVRAHLTLPPRSAHPSSSSPGTADDCVPVAGSVQLPAPREVPA